MKNRAGTGGLAAYFTLKAVELISSENHSIKKGENTSIILKLLPGTYAFSLSNRLGGRLLYSKTIDLKTQDAVIDIEKQLRKRKNNRIILWSSFSCAVVLSLGAFLFFNSPTMPIGVVIANTTTLRSGFYKQAPSQLTLVKDEEVLILQHWKPPSPNCLIVVDQSTNLETKNGYRYLQPGSVVYMIAELKNKYLVSYKNDNSEIIGSIKPEQVATPSDGSWLKIKTKTDIEGWLPSKYISIKSQ